MNLNPRWHDLLYLNGIDLEYAIPSFGQQVAGHSFQGLIPADFWVFRVGVGFGFGAGF